MVLQDVCAFLWVHFPSRHTQAVALLGCTVAPLDSMWLWKELLAISKVVAPFTSPNKQGSPRRLHVLPVLIYLGDTSWPAVSPSVSPGW